MIKNVTMDKYITMHFSTLLTGEYSNQIKTYNQKEDNKRFIKYTCRKHYWFNTQINKLFDHICYIYAK